MDSQEIIDKWDDLGFLYGLSDDTLKLNTALTYEKAANVLQNDNDEFLKVAIFPVIYRISKTGCVIKNVLDLIQKFNQFITDNRQVMDDLHGVDFDVEAEMCRIFSEDYCEWIKDNPEMDPIKYMPKHKL
jgi:hypothetical protein